MKRPTFSEFLHYRFEYPALVVDSAVAFGSGDRDNRSRLLAFVVLASLAAPAGFLIWAGSGGVSNALGLSITIVIWPMVIDFAGVGERAATALRTGASPADRFDSLWFWLANGAGFLVMASLVILHVDIAGSSSFDEGLLAGIALIWFLDLLRSMIVFLLAANDGFPLYL